MSSRAWLAAACGVSLAAGAAVVGTATARAADDDLAVVKRAVASPVEHDEEVKRDDDAKRPAARERKGARRVQWLKVRVFEKEGGKERETVSVTLPVAVLSLLGDDARVDLAKVGGDVLKDTKPVRIADILEAFEPGQPIVEVDEKDSHVKVWVE